MRRATSNILSGVCHTSQQPLVERPIIDVMATMGVSAASLR
jgi:hypothetical protein